MKMSIGVGEVKAAEQSAAFFAVQNLEPNKIIHLFIK